jgi:DNA adenine methylase
MTAQPSTGSSELGGTETKGRRGHDGAAPFLKWAGGKGQLLDVILPRLPAEITGTYVEPFIGGGAVFFELARQGRIRRAKLFDRNAELVDTYLAVRDEVEAVIEALGVHRNDEGYYYEVRAIDPSTLTRPARAARTIFLNRVGYNGLYRVNSSGRFNVPFGRYRNPRICDAPGLRHASHALALAEIVASDFEEACSVAVAGDVVYLDPPYIPLSRTANFTSYAEGRFGEEEHKRLATTFARVVDRGAYALLSNSDTELSRALYQGFKQVSVEATRAINSKADRRGVVSELLVAGLRVA